MKSVLILAAHPDDEVLGLGGTIAKMADEGYDIHLAIVTDGSSSQYRYDEDYLKIIQEKQYETKLCARLLGIRTIEYGDFPDMKLDTIPHIAINEFIEQLVERYQPEIVFTHFYGDINKDHVAVYESTMVACRPTPNQCVKKILCYRTPSSTEWNSVAFVANYFVCIDGFLETKKKAISCYTKELREYPHPRSLQSIVQNDSCAGSKVGKRYAEEFILMRCINE